MSFVHHHAPDALPSATDSCVVIQADRLLARPEVSVDVALPDFTALAQWSHDWPAPLHVGQLHGRAIWAWAAPNADIPPPAGWAWHETRALLTILTPAQSHAVSCARQLLWWDRRHRFCGACGMPTMDVVDERARRCPGCGAVYFPVVSPAVIVAVTRGDELLLAHNRSFRPNMFSLLAGFVDPGETLEQTVAREVREEAGIDVEAIQYVASQPWSYPNSLMIGFRARYLSGELRADGKEIEEAHWYRRTALPEIPRPGTIARQIIDAWLAEK